MNILHILAGPGSGGAEVYIKDLAKSLASEGHNVHIAFIGSAAELNRDLKYEKQFLQELEQSNIKTYIIGNISRKLIWKGIYKIKNYIKKNNIDICHTHLAYGIIFSMLSEAPVVYTHHQFHARWTKSVYKLFNIIVDEYIGISEKCAAELQQHTGNRQVTTIFNAVSLDKFKGYIKKREYTINQKINIVMVGRLIPQKDYITMINSISRLPKDILNRVHVLVAGEGDLQSIESLTELIERKNLHNSIELCGNILNIPEFLSDADLFLMTSIFEGLPIALTEAAISGLPCVVTDVGGCSEIINKSQNGILVPPKNPNDIANALIKLISSPALMTKYSSSAVDNAYKYSIANATKSHLEVYSRLLK